MITNFSSRAGSSARHARHRFWRLAPLPLLFLVLAFVAPPRPAHADDARAREIMQHVNDRDDGDNQVSMTEMTLIDKSGARRERKIKLFRKDKGNETLSLMFFLSPADVAGTGFLTYDYDTPGKEDDQWLYLPALRKTKRIASNDKSGSFMGSDFNYSDMTKPDLEDYDLTLVKEEVVNGVKTWQIQSVPRTPDVADKTGYAKSLVWVRQDNYVIIRGIRWVNKSPRLKYLQVRKLEQIDGIWVPTEMEMKTVAGKRFVHGTQLRQENVQFNQKLSDSLFTVRELEKGP